jgi:hypothetical protein
MTMLTIYMVLIGIYTMVRGDTYQEPTTDDLYVFGYGESFVPISVIWTKSEELYTRLSLLNTTTSGCIIHTTPDIPWHQYGTN